MSEDSLLSLSEYGVGFGERIILSSINLKIPERGIVNLMGPSGTGKSTLLRSLSGLNNASTLYRSWGQALFAGKNLGEGERPVMVAQKAQLMLSSVLENIIHNLPERHTLDFSQQRDIARRLLTRAGLEKLSHNLEQNVIDLPLCQQRHLMLIRYIAPNPRLIFIDEITTGIEDENCQPMLNYIKEEAQRRAIIIIEHNQKHAEKLGGMCALLAGGWIQEYKPASEFFQTPDSTVGKTFIKTGSCNVPSPDTPQEYLEPEALELIKERPKIPKAAREYKSDVFGPRNFLWLKKGELAGTSRPGLIQELDYDLEALKRVGVSVLVSLTTIPVDKDKLGEYDIQSIAFPIKDMGTPEIDQTKQLCSHVEDLINQGESVTYHCKAGMGRTGTMLAAQLIWQGATDFEALEEVRKIEPRWVQSEEQVQFLTRFKEALIA